MEKLTKEQQDRMAYIVKREILIIDAYNALKTDGPDNDLWVSLEQLTNEELERIISKHN